MAGVLFVIYIPCDDSSDDTPGTEGKSEGKRESKRPGTSQADDEKDTEEDSEVNQENAVNELSPLVESDSGIAQELTFQVLLPKRPCKYVAHIIPYILVFYFVF